MRRTDRHPLWALAVLMAGVGVPMAAAQAAGCYTAPVPAPMTVVSPFGPRVAPKKADGSYGTSVHRGVDLRARTPTVLYAAFNGTVKILSQGNGGCGNYIQLRSSDGGTVAQYCHLTKSLVPDGASVHAGDGIVVSGHSGGVAPHLHFMLSQRGGGSANWIDPYPRLCGATQAPSSDVAGETDAPAGEIGPYNEADLPPAPDVSSWDDLSVRAVIESEVAKRYPNYAWLDEQAARTQVPLIVENLQMRALRTYMSERQRQQKERIELMLAVKLARSNRREMEVRLERQRQAAAKAGQ